MQYVGHALHHLRAGNAVPDVTFDKFKPRRCFTADRCLHRFYVVGKASSEIVKRPHMLTIAQQRFNDVGTDKTRSTSDQPDTVAI